MKNDQAGDADEERPILSANPPGCKPGEWHVFEMAVEGRVLDRLPQERKP